MIGSMLPPGFAPPGFGPPGLLRGPPPPRAPTPAPSVIKTVPLAPMPVKKLLAPQPPRAAKPAPPAHRPWHEAEASPFKKLSCFLLFTLGLTLTFLVLRGLLLACCG